MNKATIACDRCGAILDSVRYTRYEGGEPVEVYCDACRRLEDGRRYLKDRTVSTRLMVDVSLGCFDGWQDLKLFYLELQLRVHKFEGRVWFDAGLRKFIREQEVAGLSCRFRQWEGYENNPTYTGYEVDVRCFSCAGRFLITFESGDTSVTFITEEDSPYHRMGWQSVQGKTEDILKLCDVATYGWGRAGWVGISENPVDFGLVPNSNVFIV